MEIALKTVPHFVPERAVNVGVVRSIGLSRVNAADRTDHSEAAAERYVGGFVPGFEWPVAHLLQLVVRQSYPVHVHFRVG